MGRSDKNLPSSCRIPAGVIFDGLKAGNMGEDHGIRRNSQLMTKWRGVGGKPFQIHSVRNILHILPHIVAEVAQVAASAHSAVAAEYRGLTVSEMTELRKQAREGGVYLRVVKNTLARRAVEGTDFECMQEGLQGPLVLAFSQEDPGAAARVVKAFAKDHDKLVAKLIAIGGAVLPSSDLERLASLPTLDEARAMLLGVMQAPASKLVRTLAEPAASLARVIAARQEQQAA